MKKGFTLAEVLITLAIIGVVAAMTVPTLMTSTRGKEYEVGAHKALSTLNNAMTMRQAMDGMEFSDFPGAGYNYSLKDYLTKLPANPRPGEQSALAIVQSDPADSNNFHRLKDGMVVKFAFMSEGDTHMLITVVDTNGEKGPTRTSVTKSKWNQPVCGGSGYLYTDGIEAISDDVPTTNLCPDIVHFGIMVNNPTTRGVSNTAIKPSNQRTRNILATGNAMISQ